MNSYAGPDGAPTPVRIPSSRRHGAHRAPSVILYDALVALAGWGSLVWLSLRAGQAPWALPVLLFLLLAAGLKREGFRVARLVTHSLAGVAVLAALIAIGPAGGAWVAGLSGWLVLVSRPAESGERPGLGRWRLALFGGGLNALVALAGAELYVALGGRWGLQALRGADLAAVAGLSLAWFLGDHLGWCLRIYFLEGQAGVRRFLLTIGPYSLAVELLPLPLAAVLAACYAALGTLAFVLLGLFLVGVAQVLRLLVAALNRVRQRVADLTTLEACSRALLASKLDVKELCRLLHEHTAAIVDAHAFWLGLTGGSEGSLEVALATDRAAPSDGARWAPTPELVAWVRRERAALLVRDATQEELPFGRETLAGGSALVVPMQAGGALLGLLVVRHPSPNAYSRDDLRSVVAYANQAAMAIGNARSLEAEQRRVRQITTVGEVSRRVVAMLGMDQLFAEVVALIRDAFGYYHVQLFTVDPVSGAVEFRASTNERIQQRGLQVAAGQGLVGWVAQTGEQVVVNDVASEGRYRPIEGLEGARAEAVVPLKVDERLVGILEVLSERAGAFGEEDLFVLRTLSDQVAIAIEDNRLYRAERARRRLADTLRETATALNSTLELRAVLDLVLTQLERVIRYDAAAILEWEEGRFCVIAGRGKYATPETCLAAEEGAELRRLVEAPTPFVFSRGAVDDPARASCLAAPLWVKERLIGALVLERQGAGPAYGEEEVQVASAFASQAAVAIENARLYEGEQQRARQLATIAEVGKRVASILDLDELFDQIVHLVQAEFGYYHVSLFTVDSDSGSPVFRASTSEVSASSILPIPAGKGIIGWVAANGEALLANDVQQEPRYVADDTLPATRAELAVPLKFEGRTVGVLDIQGDQPGAFKPEDLFVMQTLADQVAVAIENARLYVAQQEQAWISTALLQVAELAGRTRDLDEILAGLVRLTPMLVGVDRCSVYLWDRAAQRYLAAQGHSLADGAGERLVGRSYRVGDLPLLDRVRVTGEPVVLEEVAGSGLLPEAFAREAGMVSVLALPLRSQDEVLGIMLVDYVARQHRFPQQQVVLLTGIANEAALAIENVRLYRESLEGERIAQELRVARQIQATFLPESAPTLAGWSIAGASRPAREVGGDFYDFIHLRMHRLGLVIADVSDKGVPAALFMALSRTVMRAVAAEGQSPAAALKRANALLLADSRSGMFVTLFYGILDSESGELVYASAGHTPAYWYQHDAGRLARLVRRGVPLGVVEQPYFEEGRIILQPGDLLLLYSDGVTESLDPEMREFGEEGLRAAILAAAAQRAPEVVAAIDEAVERFVRGTPQFDDYTLLALSRDR